MLEIPESRNKNNNARKQNGAAKPKVKAFPIIAIGGSAGAFSALEKFFTHMPSDSEMAFVLIMHLDPNHKGQIAEIIKNYTSMPVHEAIDGIQVEPNHVYVIPPNKDIGIHNRKLLLLNIAKPHGFRQPIDYFFQSLADDQWNRAVGIVLSGMGSDGETGVRMIKEKLGMAMVQDPETAEYNSMPRASIGTNLVDYVLSPEEMPIKLIQYLNHPVLSEEPSEQARSEIRNTNSIQKILMLLRSHTGHDFSLYKKSTIVRRIDRRVAFHQLPDYVHYVNYLRENPLEIDILFNELLIGVTKFFRDIQAYDSLKNKLANVIRHKKNDEPIRVWIAGCSTGEEAYSIAILLIECLDDDQNNNQLPKIQIFATDLDADAIEQARQGNYYENIGADVSAERLERFFVKNEGSYTVRKDLREMIVFAQHNLIKDAPFTRLDLLCCRNVMIYLTTELQRKIIPVFHYSLNEKGIMFMGPAETIGGFTELFVPTDPKWKLFERKQGSTSLNKMIDFPFHVARQPAAMLKMEEIDKSSKISVADAFNKILLENFTPTSILINDKGDILYTNGKAGNFLQLPRGEAVMNIYKMAREELRYVLGNVIHQARSQKALVTIKDIKLNEGGNTALVNLHASMLEESGLQGLLLVVIEDKGLINKSNRKVTNLNGRNQAIEDMEKELVYTKQQLHSTIEQMETSLEELKSTNEELQSTNEELQSTNEESLTTKEEMQSLNEELMTVNMQYQSKADELSRLNNDMKNLLDSTEIGTIFLNNNLEILRYTPQIKKLFNIIPTDVGRSLSDIVSNFDYAHIEEIIREVIERLFTKQIEVKTKNNDWYTVRIMPYRTLDNFISGAVLTFTLITNYKQMEFKLKALQKYSASVVNQVRQPALQLDSDLNVLTVNDMFLETFNTSEREIKGISFSKFIEQRWEVDNLVSLLMESGRSGQNITSRFAVNEQEFELSTNSFIDEETNEKLLMLLIINQL